MPCSNGAAGSDNTSLIRSWEDLGGGGGVLQATPPSDFPTDRRKESWETSTLVDKSSSLNTGWIELVKEMPAQSGAYSSHPL